MPFRFYDTATRKVQAFKPIKSGHVSLYTCGPTVYDYAHIGNFRTFSAQDLLRRYLQYLGYSVRHVMNLTDVDDKTIKRSLQEKKPLKEVTQFYSEEFLKDMDSLRCLRPTVLCNATDVIPEIITMIETLVAKKHAYVGEDGSVYFSVKSFKNYGKLAHLEKVSLKAGARISNDEYDKEAAADFALWKSHSKEDGDVQWDSPWGKGRPGWHIECSAISTKFLGPTFDIHTGGIDLLFPHHQNETAQSECCFDKPFAKYWLHGAHILVDNRKMSKSLGNFHTLHDLQLKDPRALRFFFLLAHYRSETNFTLAGLKDAEKSVQRLDDWIERLQRIPAGKSKKPLRVKPLIKRWQNQLLRDLNDDLNTPEAVKHLFEIMRETNRFMEDQQMDYESAQTILDFLFTLDAIFPVFKFESKKAPIPPHVQQLVKDREAARKAKDWAKADAIRAELLHHGFELMDTADGPQVRKKD